MHRRDFIKIMAQGSTVAFLPTVLTACGESVEPGLEAWKGPLPGESDIRMLVLSYAILAPNPHNKQPWIVDLKGAQSFDLYVDQSRLLPETDPPSRQVHIGQGTFLENADLAARKYGYHMEVSYFPDGMYANTELEEKPVASVVLVKDPTVPIDPLFKYITTRQTNKRAYDNTPVTARQLELLASSFDMPDMSLNLTDGVEKRQNLAKILTKAMQIETYDKARDAETIAMFRFNDAERARFRDGFGVAQTGMTGIAKFVAETFFLDRKKTEADSTEFGEQAVKIAMDQANSAQAFGWITTPSNSRLDQVLAGRAYERVNLKATELGLAMHPMSQVLEEYADMGALQQEFLSYLRIPYGHTVQMLFRLGHADPVQHSARRPISDITKS